MHLKVKDISWDPLMYVAFDKDGQTIKWYPKWKDLADVFDSALATESGHNQGKLTNYLLFVCLEMLTRNLLIEADAPSIRKYNALSDELRQELLNERGDPST